MFLNNRVCHLCGILQQTNLIHLKEDNSIRSIYSCKECVTEVIKVIMNETSSEEYKELSEFITSKRVEDYVLWKVSVNPVTFQVIMTQLIKFGKQKQFELFSLLSILSGAPEDLIVSVMEYVTPQILDAQYSKGQQIDQSAYESISRDNHLPTRLVYLRLPPDPSPVFLRPPIFE